MKISRYLYDRLFALGCFLLTALLLAALLWLVATPAVFIMFAELLLVFGALAALAHDFLRKRRYYNKLLTTTDKLDEKTLLSALLPRPNFLEGQLLAETLRRTNKYYNDQIAAARLATRDYREYIESWVHEIKTPIATAQLLAENDKTTTTMQIDDALRQIDSYVEQALYYARSTDVAKDFKLDETTLHALVASALKKYSKPLIQAGARPRFENLDVPVTADSKSVVFILGQLITNAIQYRRDTLCLDFVGQVTENSVRLLLCDNGIGIPPADLPRVFDKGFTGTNGRGHAQSTGIGLYLSQTLCRKMNIMLSIDSTVGEGTTVTLTFPRKKTFHNAGL